MASVSFSGLSSGLDTDSIVEALCATANSKVTKSEQAEAKIEIQQEVWKAINSKIYSFYTGLDKIRMAGSFSSVKASSSSTSVATIASSANLEEGNHILEVEQLAEKATLATRKITYTDDNGKKQTASKTTTLGQILGNGKADGSTITATGTDAEGNTYNTDIILSDDMTIAELETELSAALGHCSVKYNESLGTFSVYSKTTGAEQTISLTATDADGQSSTALASLGFKTTSAVGQDLKATYDGMTIEYASNEFEVAGSTSNSTIKVSVTGIGKTTLSATQDTEGVYDMIKSFVDDYNSIVKEISDLVDAEYSKLAPLTDEEKEEMSEKEIEEYNEKLRGSALRNDTTLTSLRSALRKIISETKIVDENGKTINLNSIGIKSSSNYADNGKLTIDEDTLRAAIEENPEAITSLFTSRTEDSEGIATKLYSKLDNSFKRTEQKSTGCLYNDKVLEKNLKNQKKETTTLEERLESLKEIYYAKFTAMETMLSTLNSQTATLSSYFSS